MSTIKNFLLVGIGAGIGGMIRYLMSLVFKSQSFPFNTLLINVLGSLIIGILFSITERQTQSSEQIKLFFATGICGGFTTFSAFSLENMQLLKTGNYIAAISYITLSVLFCIAAVFAGYKLLNI